MTTQEFRAFIASAEAQGFTHVSTFAGVKPLSEWFPYGHFQNDDEDHKQLNLHFIDEKHVRDCLPEHMVPNFHAGIWTLHKGTPGQKPRIPLPAVQNQMYVYPAADTGVWMIEHVGPHAEKIQEHFETVVIPSAFRLPITGPAVCECLRSANPGVFVDYFETEADWKRECANNG